MTPAELLWSAVGALLTALWKWYQGRRVKAQIRATAARKLRDPNETDDPEQALEAATIETMRPRMRGESRKLRAMLNGDHSRENGLKER